MKNLMLVLLMFVMVNSYGQTSLFSSKKMVSGKDMDGYTVEMVETKVTITKRKVIVDTGENTFILKTNKKISNDFSFEMYLEGKTTYEIVNSKEFSNITLLTFNDDTSTLELVTIRKKNGDVVAY